DVLRHAGDDVEDRRDRDQLAGRNRERAEPQQDGYARADLTSVAQLEKVADRLEIARGRDASDARADPQRQHRRARRGGAAPPTPRPSSASAAGPRADRRRAADVSRDHRRKDQARAERPPPNEQSPRARPEPPDPQAEPDEQRRIPEEQPEVQRHPRRAIVA